jgi:hypothetical protein
MLTCRLSISQDRVNRNYLTVLIEVSAISYAQQRQLPKTSSRTAARKIGHTMAQSIKSLLTTSLRS